MVLVGSWAPLFQLLSGKLRLLGGSITLVSIERVQGSDFDDSITGSNGADVLAGGAGNDTLDGGLGIDTASYAYSASGVSASRSGISFIRNGWRRPSSKSSWYMPMALMLNTMAAANTQADMKKWSICGNAKSSPS